MSTIYQTVSSCLQKKSENIEPAPSDPTMESVNLDNKSDPEEVKENDAPELQSDKKTDEILEPQKPTSFVWRVSSGLYSTTTGAITGAVGLSVGGVKWVAGKSIDAGSAVVTTTKNVASKVPVHIPKWKAKAKSE